MIHKYSEWNALNEGLIGKTIWKTEFHDKLSTIATREYDPKLVEDFQKKITEKANKILTALSCLEVVEASNMKGPKHPNRCFLSSLEFSKDFENMESVVGLLRRKGSMHVYVHAFNKQGENYYDNSLEPDEFSQYEHYPIQTVLAKDEEDLATQAWLIANSLQKAVE